MRTIKKILVPVDYSESSMAALEYALIFAEKFEASVHVLHSWEVPAYVRPDLTVWSGDVSNSLADHVRYEAESGMVTFLERANAANRRGVTSEVVGGAPYASILTAAETGYDLIVMGTHGRTGMSRMLLGSVAERVVRHAPCAVLTLRAPSPKQ